MMIPCLWMCSMHMRKYITNAFCAVKIGTCSVALFCCFLANGYQRFPSLTSFRTRPFLQYASFLLPVREEQDSFLFLMPIHTSTIKKCSYAPAFLFGEKSYLTCIGDEALRLGGNTPGNIMVPPLDGFLSGIPPALCGSRDIRAEFIGGSPTTQAAITCSPHQNMNGVILGAMIPLRKVFDSEFSEKMVFGIRTALTYVKQNMGLAVSALNQKDAQSIQDFLSPLHLNYAGMDSSSSSIAGLENITFTLGSRYDGGCGSLKIDYYSGIEIPTQSSALPEKIFTPTYGNNGHWGLLTGFASSLLLKESSSLDISAFINGEGHFFIHKSTLRTCDLYGKPWSRYLPLVSNGTSTTIVAEEITTVQLRVHPLAVADLSMGLIFNTSCIKGRIGYNLWAKSQEYTDLDDRHYPGSFNRLLQYGIPGTNPSVTASATNIAQQGPDDITARNPTFIPLNFSNLDYDSAGYPSGHSQSLFASIDFVQEEGFNSSLGGWIEYGSEPFIPSRYGLWASIGSAW